MEGGGWWIVDCGESGGFGLGLLAEKLKSKFKPKLLLSIDFKSAYNNVNLDMLSANLIIIKI